MLMLTTLTSSSILLCLCIVLWQQMQTVQMLYLTYLLRRRCIRASIQKKQHKMGQVMSNSRAIGTNTERMAIITSLLDPCCIAT